MTGLLHGLLAAGRIRPLVSSTYGLVPVVKVGPFGSMLLLGNQGRAFATRLARREIEDRCWSLPRRSPSRRPAESVRLNRPTGPAPPLVTLRP